MNVSTCFECGQLRGIDEYDQELWNLYWRLRDGRQYSEPLVFTGDWLDENVQDQDDVDIINLAMSRNMRQRGLCSTCGRPDLSGVCDEDVMTDEEARDLADMAAEQAAERRAGC